MGDHGHGFVKGGTHTEIEGHFRLRSAKSATSRSKSARSGRYASDPSNSAGEGEGGGLKKHSNKHAGKELAKLRKAQDLVYKHTDRDMEAFLQQSRFILEAAVERSHKASRKKGWELHFETGVLGELAAVATAASKAAAAAAMTAAAAAAATAAALRGAIEFEPMLKVMADEAAKPAPAPEPVEEAARWGHTKARGSQILKPLGYLDEQKKQPGKVRKNHQRKLNDDELPEILKVGSEAANFDASGYAAQKAAKIKAAKARRGSTAPVALPAIQKGKAKKGKKETGKAGKGKAAAAAAASAAAEEGEDEEAEAAPMATMAEEEEEEEDED
jgi:hypothetical protein